MNVRRHVVASLLALLVVVAVAIPPAAAMLCVETDQTTGSPPAQDPGVPRSRNPRLWVSPDKRHVPEKLPPPRRGPGAPDAGSLVQFDLAGKRERVLPRAAGSEMSIASSRSTPESQGLWPEPARQESVLGLDDRARVTPTYAFPWRTIVKVFMTFPDGLYMCSGALIGRGSSSTVGYHVLTAGHCVYDPAKGWWASSIEVIPAYDDGYMPYGNAYASQLYTWTAWTTTGDWEHDAAVVVLDRPMGSALGFMGRRTAAYTDPIYTDLASTAGYPGDIAFGEQMYFDSDYGQTATENKHWYYMDTAGGQSGSAVWRLESGVRQILTVHAYGSSGTSNSGTRLNATKLADIDTITITDPAPVTAADLLDDFATTLSPSVLARGAWASVQPTLRNIGTTAAGPFRVSFYLSTNTIISVADHLLGTVNVTGLAPFATGTVTWSGRVPGTVPPGTYYVGWLIDDQDGVVEYDEANNIGMAADPVTVASGPTGDTDLNGDAKADIVWRNNQTGQLFYYFMNGSAIGSTAPGDTVADVNWKLMATADFDNDGKADLFWRHALTGQNEVWFMNGGTRVSGRALQAQADLRWTMAGVADFNADATPDLLWRNTVTGDNVVWLMNGTTRVSTAALPHAGLPWAIAGAGDYNGDGHADVLWRNPTTGDNHLWLMNGLTLASGHALTRVADTTWRIVGTGDYNGDLRPDILWRNTHTGQVVTWYMNGTTVLSTYTILASSGSDWDILHGDAVASTVAPDFNADGKPDVFWRHGGTGENIAWLMNGATSTGYVRLTSITDTAWRAVGFADFNADGKTDIVWRNSANGQNIVWYMNGAARTSYATLLTVADTSWKIVSAGDFNADGKPDILWRSATTGQNVVWYMNGAVRTATATLLAVADVNWKVMGTGDFNGDGKTDILWRHATTGENAVWLMNGVTRTSAVMLLGVSDTSFTVASVADFNADGKPDVLWRSYGSGQNVVWFMNGTARSGYAALSTVADTAWRAGNDPR